MSLQAAANGMDADNDILFLILTSHGSRAGLAVKAGRLTQTLTPSNLAYMLARIGMRYKVVVPTINPILLAVDRESDDAAARC